jgi:hypothetical protein
MMKKTCYNGEPSAALVCTAPPRPRFETKKATGWYFRQANDRPNAQ